MNVMAKAHKATREAYNMVGGKGISYKALFRAALKDFHRIAKEQRPVNEAIAQQIASTEAFVAKLEAALLDNEQVQGFIIVIGEGRICSNAELGYSTNVLNAPIYMHLEDAEYYASRVQNGLGEKGEVVGKYSQLKYEVEQQKQLLESLKKA